MDAITPPSIKERPIIFSAAMVRAILEGRKTQTRRVVKPGKWETEDSEYGVSFGKCPYGQPGDRLWVRETWQPLWADLDIMPPYGMKSAEGWAIGYPATDGIQEYYNERDGLVDRCMPSIHMPRWASRILLEIVSVRVERLQNMSEDDARAEGVTPEIHESREYGAEWKGSFWSAFIKLWVSIHGKGSYNANPWVWVVEFKRVEA